MGAIGKYLDALPDEARDRVLTAQDWCVKDFYDEAGARCLVGHAEDWADGTARARNVRFLLWEQNIGGITTGEHFDAIAERVGLDRAVRLVKQRAGKRTRVDTTEPALTTATPS